MVRCVKLRHYKKNTLQAFVDLELSNVGLVLRDCTWHRHPGGKEWVGFSAKPYETESGERAWQPIIEFAEGAGGAREQFQRQAFAAIHNFVEQETVP